jgi:hypothetical protein
MNAQSADFVVNVSTPGACVAHGVGFAVVPPDGSRVAGAREFAVVPPDGSRVAYYFTSVNLANACTGCTAMQARLSNMNTGRFFAL